MSVAAFHPGEILKELYLDPLGMSSGRLAGILGLPRTRIERLVKGETAMTVDTAAHLARAFRTTPQYWMNLQNNFDIQVYEKSDKARHIESIEPVVARSGEAEIITA